MPQIEVEGLPKKSSIKVPVKLPLYLISLEQLGARLALAGDRLQ
jgi:hypothetical protein